VDELRAVVAEAAAEYWHLVKHIDENTALRLEVESLRTRVSTLEEAVTSRGVQGAAGAGAPPGS
jgi:regulator of replication initiation timing